MTAAEGGPCTSSDARTSIRTWCRREAVLPAPSPAASRFIVRGAAFVRHAACGAEQRATYGVHSNKFMPGIIQFWQHTRAGGGRLERVNERAPNLQARPATCQFTLAYPRLAGWPVCWPSSAIRGRNHGSPQPTLEIIQFWQHTRAGGGRLERVNERAPNLQARPATC